MYVSTCTQVTELLISWMVCIGPTEKVTFNKSLEREKKKSLRRRKPSRVWEETLQTKETVRTKALGQKCVWSGLREG